MPKSIKRLWQLTFRSQKCVPFGQSCWKWRFLMLIKSLRAAAPAMCWQICKILWRLNFDKNGQKNIQFIAFSISQNTWKWNLINSFSNSNDVQCLLTLESIEDFSHKELMSVFVCVRLSVYVHVKMCVRVSVLRMCMCGCVSVCVCVSVYTN